MSNFRKVSFSALLIVCFSVPQSALSESTVVGSTRTLPEAIATQYVNKNRQSVFRIIDRRVGYSRTGKYFSIDHCQVTGFYIPDMREYSSSREGWLWKLAIPSH
jgi:hypothetical protein